MRVLIIKMSSMGDVIHTLPALTDASKAIPSISFDWVVEENFSEVPAWHPSVDKIIPIALRRWRKTMFTKKTREEWRAFRQAIQTAKYDLIIDAQGLFKSAFVALYARGKRCGFNFHSAREPFSAFLYHQKVVTEKIKEVHAITRVRNLFSQALGYALPTTMPDYGVDRERFLQSSAVEENYLVFLHGTTWETKHWPEAYWIQLAAMASNVGLKIKLPWGNASEQARAQRIAATCEKAEVLSRQGLAGIASMLANAKAIVAVDTGLGHLAAALNVPTVSLYSATNPLLTGALGKAQKHLSVHFPCAPCFGRECTYRGRDRPVEPPCFATLSPSAVWDALIKFL